MGNPGKHAEAHADGQIETRTQAKTAAGGTVEMLTIYLSALDTQAERDKLAYLYETYKEKLIRIARGRLHGALAEDAVHDTFLEVIRHKEKILSKSPTDFFRWSVIVLENKITDIMRRDKHINTAAAIDDENVGEIPSGDKPLDLVLSSREDYELIMKCLPDIDPVNRQILWRKYVLGMSYGEIAAEMSLTAEQMASRIARTKEKLRGLFEKRGGER